MADSQMLLLNIFCSFLVQENSRPWDSFHLCHCFWGTSCSTGAQGRL